MGSNTRRTQIDEELLRKTGNGRGAVIAGWVWFILGILLGVGGIVQEFAKMIASS